MSTNIHPYVGLDATIKAYEPDDGASEETRTFMSSLFTGGTGVISHVDHNGNVTILLASGGHVISLMDQTILHDPDEGARRLRAAGGAK